MGVQGPFAGDGLLVHPGPVSAVEGGGGDTLGVDAGAELGDVDGEGEEEPLAEEGCVEFGGEEGEEDADGVGGGEEVDEEEVVGFVGGGGDEEGDGGFLAGFELFGGVGEGPGVPVLEDEGLVGLEERFDVVGAGVGEEVVEAGVVRNALEDFERVGGEGGRWAREGRVVEIFMEIVV